MKTTTRSLATSRPSSSFTATARIQPHSTTSTRGDGGGSSTNRTSNTSCSVVGGIRGSRGNPIQRMFYDTMTRSGVPFDAISIKAGPTICRCDGCNEKRLQKASVLEGGNSPSHTEIRSIQVSDTLVPIVAIYTHTYHTHHTRDIKTHIKTHPHSHLYTFPHLSPSSPSSPPHLTEAGASRVEGATERRSRQRRERMGGS